MLIVFILLIVKCYKVWIAKWIVFQPNKPNLLIKQWHHGTLGCEGTPTDFKSCCAENVVGYAFIPSLSNVAPFTSPYICVCRDEEYLGEYQGLLVSLNANVNPAEAAHLMLNHADVFIQAPLHKS